MLTLLALDTATNACSAALLVNSQYWQRFELAPRQHAELILGMVDSLLNETNSQLSDVDAIAYGHGPGSFMGVRIATAVAQALGFAAKKPLIPVSTLQALAQEAYKRYQVTSVLAAWDARMGEVYWGIYCLDDAQLMQAQRADCLSSFAELTKILINDNLQVELAVGNVWELYSQPLAQGLLHAKQIDAQLYPTAAAIASVAAASYRRGETVTATAAQPFYLRNQVANKPGAIRR